MNIVNILSKQNVTFTLKYFGINDMATVHDIEIILNNHECILRYFKQFKHYNIDTIDDFINYLAVLKFCEIEDVIPHLISSEHKKIFIKFTSEIEPILKNIIIEM